jgi:ABC-type uncharacterized transport system auxiliary subunit
VVTDQLCRKREIEFMHMKKLFAASLVALFIVGCGPKVAQNRDLTLKLTETTEMHPVRMSVAVDGVEVFGPLATLKPGETQTVKLNDPPSDTQLEGQHTILYTFDRTGLIGTVGHARMEVMTDNAVIFEDDSRKVLTGFMPTYSFQYVITDPDPAVDAD